MTEPLWRAAAVCGWASQSRAWVDSPPELPPCAWCIYPTKTTRCFTELARCSTKTRCSSPMNESQEEVQVHRWQAEERGERREDRRFLTLQFSICTSSSILRNDLRQRVSCAINFFFHLEWPAVGRNAQKKNTVEKKCLVSGNIFGMFSVIQTRFVHIKAAHRQRRALGLVPLLSLPVCSRSYPPCNLP